MNDKESMLSNTLHDESEVISRSRACFDAACAQVGARRSHQLAAARRQALAARPKAAWHSSGWLPLAGAAAACCVLAIGAWMHAGPAVQPRPAASAAPVATAAAGDPGTLPDVDSNRMDIAQDLDFYRWLAAQPALATAHGSRR